jgi:hypothetical protein
MGGILREKSPSGQCGGIANPRTGRNRGTWHVNETYIRDTSDSNNELAFASLAATSNSLLSETFRYRTNMPVGGVIDRLSLLVLLQVRVSHRDPIRR